MILEFDYLEDKPIIPVILENNNKQLSIEFFVDSGADMTMIPLSFAKELGFTDWTEDELKLAQGIEGGSIQFFIRKVKVILKDVKFEIEIACSLRDNIPLLIGRKDIFDRFIICFDNKNKKVRFIDEKTR